MEALEDFFHSVQAFPVILSWLNLRDRKNIVNQGLIEKMNTGSRMSRRRQGLLWNSIEKCFVRASACSRYAVILVPDFFPFDRRLGD